MAIAQQLQAESTNQNNTGQTVSVTLGAGSSRYMVVALVGERTSITAPSSVTYGGNALALITDGTVTASNTSTAGGVFLYRLLEASMPANGANDLIVSWGSTTDYIMGWWILTGVQQGNAADVKNTAETTTATTITATLDAGATTDAVICAVYKNDTTGTVAITISGAGVTEDFDVSLTTGGARGAAGTDLPAVASGTIACVATVSSTGRRIITAIRLAEAVSAANISGGFSLGPVTLTGDVEHNPAEISGGFALGPVTLTGDATTEHDISGGFSTPVVAAGGTATVLNRPGLFGPVSTPPLTFDGTLVLTSTISGGFSLGPVAVAGDATVTDTSNISGGFSLGVVSVAGEVDNVATVSGGFLFGPVTLTGNVTTEHDISGAIVLGAVQVAGDVAEESAAQITGGFSTPSVAAGGTATVLDRPGMFGPLTTPPLTFDGSLVLTSTISGGFTFGAVQVAGDVNVTHDISGAIVIGAVQVSGIVRTQFPGSCIVTDEPSGTVELEDGPSFGALATDAPSGTVELEDGPAFGALLFAAESGSATIGDQAI